MEATLITAIGGVAALASTVSFMPQAIKIIRTRDTSGVSTGMYIVTVIGFTLWTAYGCLLRTWPIIASNGICLALSAFILTIKILPPGDRNALADAIEPIVGKEEPGRATSRGMVSPSSRSGDTRHYVELT